MVKKKRKIQWNKQVTRSLIEAIAYIRKDSPQNADKVNKEILSKIRELVERPEIHPPDKYRKNCIGNNRAFEIHHYRISYLVKTEEVIIARIRHTSQKPEEY